jgi:hypothetical protein
MVVREAFKDLLKGYARSHDLVFIPEYKIETPAKERRYVDGALLHALRVPFGYWEAKDEKDDLNAEIEHKLRRGYPQDNIIFEDSREVVLLQNKLVVMRAQVDDVAALQLLLDLFFGYERPEINLFRKAVEQFKTDLPAVLESLREMIAKAALENPAFRAGAARIGSHHEKQTFLKVIYENFYKVYNRKAVEFPNLCFVDTIDNVAGLRKYSGHQDDLFGSVSEENVERIKRQNRRKISVIIGNPPYNANQLNENENNKNREYPDIDKRIKETYIKESTAQKTKLYDMYARFFRWASDRVDENGVVAFISNRSFIESRIFDGFRKVVGREFNEIHIVDLGGDVRANPKLSGTKHNVFGIQTGVAISFLVKRKKTQGCRFFYSRRPELETAEEKLAFLGDAKLPRIDFDEIRPDANHNWLNLTQNDFESLMPIATKYTKAAKKPSQEKAIIKLFSLGVVTARDEWVYDDQSSFVSRKVEALIDAYNADLKKLSSVRGSEKLAELLDYTIKSTSSVSTTPAP